MRRRSALGLALAGALLFALPSAGGPARSPRAAARAPAQARAPASARAHCERFFSGRAFSAALDRLRGRPPAPMPGARALVVPHHWLAGHLIVGGLRDLAASGRRRRVILIGPNHVGAGSAAVATSDLPWDSRFGRVEPDSGAISRLVSAGLARSEPDTLSWEHSVAGIVPVVAWAMPGARLVPLAVRAGRSAAEVRALARALAPLMDPGTVLVASVDFSHYLSAAEARARDSETIAVLRGLDSRRILAFGNEHLDSPPSIATVMETARLLGATRFELRARGDSSQLGGSALSGVTSYVEGFWRAGAGR